MSSVDDVSDERWAHMWAERELDDLREAQVARLAGARNMADAAVVALAAVVLAGYEWQQGGIMSPGHWATWKFGVTAGRARQIMLIARRWSELPCLAGVFGSGFLSFEQAHLIARYCPAAYEESVVEFARSATVSQLSRSMRGYSFDADSSEDPDPDDLNWTDRFSGRFTEKGRYRGSFDFDADTGKRIEAAIRQRRLQVNEANDDSVGFASDADAVAECFEAASDADPSDSRRSASRTLMHVDLRQLTGLGDDVRLDGRLHLGPMLPSEWVRHGLCDADIQTLVHHGGRATVLGRTVRTVPSWLRDIVIDRDGGCRYPGCGNTRFLDVHHIVHWVEGGETSPDNLVCLCRKHHRAHHHGDFLLAGTPEQPCVAGSLRFMSKHGWEIKPPVPIPPTESIIGTYQHPIGETVRDIDISFEPAPFDQPDPDPDPDDPAG